MDSLDTAISSSREELHRNMSAGFTGYPAYVVHGNFIIRKLADTICRDSLTTGDKVAAIVKYVSSLRIITNGCRIKLPIETLVEGSGTVNDLAILVAALFASEHIECVLLLKDSSLAVAVRDGDSANRYIYRGKTFMPIYGAIKVLNCLDAKICGPWISGEISLKGANSCLEVIQISKNAINDCLLYKGSRKILKLKEEAISSIVNKHKSDLMPLAVSICGEVCTKEEQASRLLEFVQLNIEYALDDPEDRLQLPIETLFRRKGDCEDSSLLYAALCRCMGISVILYNPPGHIAVGVKGDFQGESVKIDNSNYYYTETTALGWQIGIVPPERGEVNKMRVIALENKHHPNKLTSKAA